MPEALLARLSLADRTARWKQILGESDNVDDSATFIAEDDATAVGFASCCRQRTPELKARGLGGEIGAIYVMRAAQGRGIGSALMRLMAQHLLTLGHPAASLWVLRENVKTRRFYDRLGGDEISERENEREGMILTEVAYGWCDLTKLSKSETP